jgi:hypothetical protein
MMTMRKITIRLIDLIVILIIASTLTRADMDDLEVKVVRIEFNSLQLNSGVHHLLHDNVLQLSATDV